MISFRFHLVSITAVFLAIAIGVVVGSTFVDRAIVDGLEARIDTVSANLDARREEIAGLDSALDREREFTEAIAPFAVADRLAEVPVLVVAAEGVDEGVVRDVTDHLAQAGAVVPGTVWLLQDWVLDDDGRARDLRTTTGATATDRGLLQRQGLQAAIAQLLGDADDPPDDAADGASEGAEDEATQPGAGEGAEDDAAQSGDEPDDTAVEPAPDLLGALADGGFVRFDPVADDRGLGELDGTDPHVLLVTGPAVDADLKDATSRLVDVLAQAELPLLVAEVSRDDENDPPRGSTATGAVPDRRREVVAVVDHLDTVPGRVTAVVVLSMLDEGVTGTFGVGPEADAPMPAWAPP